jgi:hypothetical protein
MDFEIPFSFGPYGRLVNNVVLLLLQGGLVGFFGGAVAAVAARLMRRGLPPLFRPLRHIFLVLHGVNILVDVLSLASSSQVPAVVTAVLVNLAGAALWLWGARPIRELETPRIGG